jgi:hypothetical protein
MSVYGKKFFSRSSISGGSPRPPLASVQLSPKAQRLMEILKAHARGGEVEISYRELMSETGWSRVTISRCSEGGTRSWPSELGSGCSPA